MSRIIPCLLAALLLLISGPSVGEEKTPAYAGLPLLTLKDAVNQARTTHPGLQVSRERITQAKARVKMAYSLLLPFLNLQGTYTRMDQRIALNFGDMSDMFRLLQVNCMSWDEATMGPIPELCNAPPESSDSSSEDDSSGGNVIQDLNNWDGNVTVGISLLNLRTFPQIKNVYSALDIARLQDKLTEEVLLYAVISLYYAVATSQTAVTLMMENLDNARSHLELVKARELAQTALPNERIRIEMLIAQARSDRDQAVIALKHARKSLAILIGRKNSDFRVATEQNLEPTGPVGSVEPETLGRRKDIQMLDKSIEITERSVTDIWVQFLPTLQAVWTMSASSNKGFSDRYTQWRAMITLNWNLFAGGIRFAQLDEARSRIREARHNRRARLLEAQTEVEAAAREVKSATRAIQGGMEMEALARKNLDLVRIQYREGVVDQSLVLDADFQFRASRLQVLQGRLRLALAYLTYTRSIGRFKEQLERL